MNDDKTEIVTAEQKKLKIPILQDEKHKSLFEEDLKNIYFSQTDREGLTALIDPCIESLSSTYLMWFTYKKENPSNFKKMTMPSIWFFVYGVILQILVGKKWQLEVADTVAGTAANYIVAMALDLFGVRAGTIKAS